MEHEKAEPMTPQANNPNDRGCLFGGRAHDRRDPGRCGTEDDCAGHATRRSTALPAADIMELSVGRDGSNLVVLVHLFSGIPAQGSYPGAGIEWSFDVRGRTYVAEGHPEPGEMRYTLFEVINDTFTQIENARRGRSIRLTGEMVMNIPLGLIGAKPGTKVSGTGPKGTEDVDIHQHAGPAGSPLLDSMATSRDYVVPR